MTSPTEPEPSSIYDRWDDTAVAVIVAPERPPQGGALEPATDERPPPEPFNA